MPSSSDPRKSGHAAFASIVGLGISPTPDNFAIWFDYHSGLNPELSHIVDMLLAQPKRFDDRVMEAIHRKFFAHANEREALQQASTRMQGLLQEVGSMVGDAGADADRFGRVVRVTSRAFAEGAATLPALIQQACDEARDMATRSERLALHLTAAAERIQQLERSLDDVRRDAATDGLTGLCNRRSFDARLREAAGRAMNTGEPLTLLLADIDHFKRVNDTWGHPTGDQVLRLVAATITGQLRMGDTAARYGGEEFAVILPSTLAEEAAAVAERVRRAFEGRQLVARASGTTINGVTVSFGGAGYDPGERLAGWIERADRALYAAKQAGRNRVHMASHPAERPAAAPPRQAGAGVPVVAG